MSTYPAGTSYFTTSRVSPSGLKTVIRTIAAEGDLLSEEVFSPHRGGWINTTEITKWLNSMSEEEWHELPETEALRFVGCAQEWWQQQEVPGRAMRTNG